MPENAFNFCTNRPKPKISSTLDEVHNFIRKNIIRVASNDHIWNRIIYQ
jgi:hypothetical protein